MKTTLPRVQVSSLKRPGHVLVLLAWLLLSLQAPWHAGMAAGGVLQPAAGAGLAEALGLRCGTLPDAATLQRLADDGYIVNGEPDRGDRAQAPGLCDLFAAQLTPATTSFPAVLSISARAPAPPAPAALLPATHLRQTPPARGPPAHA